MTRRHAIDLAIEARTRKTSSSLLSVGPLPDGVKDLLRIVADGEWCSPATEHAYRLHSAEYVRDASAAFLAGALFHRTADAYRVLGVGPDASSEDVRENKRLLLKWLHPDRNPSPGARSHLARVLEAAEAIEEGRARAAAPPELPPRIVVQPRAKKTRRAKPDPVKAAAHQLASAAVRAGKFIALTAFAALIALMSWRYVMDEPIGASLERYTRLAVGMAKW
jgi:hypothetical protein